MKRLILALSLATTSCVNGVIPTSPAIVANTTILDEKAGTSFELAYKAFRIAVETRVDAGLKSDHAKQLAALDNELYGLILAERAAYKSANATSYYAAISAGEAAIADGLTILKGK